MARTHYDVLMLSPAADRELISAVYRHLAKRYHPDRDDSPAAAARMTELNEAYAVLRDAGKRRRYDERMGIREPAGPVPLGVDRSGGVGGATADSPIGDVSAGTFERGYGSAGAPPPNPAPSGQPLTFGRYRGWTLNQVGRHDRDYLEWLSRTTMGRIYKDELTELLRRR